MINLKIKKIFLILITITLSLSLVSCKTDFSKYSGIYVMTTYEVEEKDPDEQVDYDFDVIKKYNIELKENGYAVHTLFLGVMDEEVAFSNHYDVLEKKGEIHFYIKQGLAVTNKEEWDFIDNIITLKLEVPIVKEPTPTNDSHYVNVTIKLQKDNKLDK